MPGMLEYSLPVKKGFFVMRFFAFRMERRAAFKSAGRQSVSPASRE